MQGGAHACSRRLVELGMGDVLLHTFDALHGVEIEQGLRYSLVLWFSTSAEACTQRDAPWLREAVTRGDAVAHYRCVYRITDSFFF